MVTLKVNSFSLCLLIIIFLFSIIRSDEFDKNGYGMRIKNIEAWGGIMGPNYDYFDKDNLDIFNGKIPCLTGPVCSLDLASYGSGQHHGWYCNYVEVTSIESHIPYAQELFTVEQWLATDAPPYQLTVILNQCGDKSKINMHGCSTSSSSPVVSVM